MSVRFDGDGSDGRGLFAGFPLRINLYVEEAATHV